MNRQSDFTSSEAHLDKTIEQVLQRDFALPDAVKRAQSGAFDKIRAEAQARTGKETKKGRGRGRRKALTIAGTLAASAAVFSTICISNPAFAANIPLVGHVFAEIGSSLGFSGDYEKYATSLQEAKSGAAAEEQIVSAVDGQTAPAGAEAAATGADKSYSQTFNGVTVTLSEVYCNDMSLNVALVVRSEEGFPDIRKDEDGNAYLYLRNGTLLTDYYPEAVPITEPVEGRLTDEHTFAGVMRFDLVYTTESVQDEYFEARNDFFAEKLGISREELDTAASDVYDRLREILGTDVLSASVIASAGGPDIKDYTAYYEVPEDFSVTLKFDKVVADLAEASLPAMPQELVDEYKYNAALAEHGLDIDDYENFTEEEKQIEHQLFEEQQRKYDELYPDAGIFPNRYENWWKEGEWDFTFGVSKNTADSQVLEINDFDESGLGVTRVTKTPFEIVVEMQSPSESSSPSGMGYFLTALDENGKRLPYGSGSSTNTFAVQGQEISRIDVYICDYEDFMSIKGRLLSGEGADNRTLLEEMALYHKEIVFE
ncbi:DUF4179 domain-containing protein [Marvinbryantia formatexigens]|uniref:DUF4179 domain-containing protein n=1 Tax=Marvinbryantia formatexigens TaxID=168384 RepID=UPI00030A809D|nr:DUF4179 domain-containing protein [Marvinbryantia formatexigens]UWO24544.1 DUF4179 domain-containing protein [Marvinbryantia formatexigens DSM 14469]SDF12554.1 protein of unknown function [Marvinbryantia formatexigens]